MLAKDWIIALSFGDLIAHEIELNMPQVVPKSAQRAVRRGQVEKYLLGTLQGHDGSSASRLLGPLGAGTRTT